MADREDQENWERCQNLYKRYIKSGLDENEVIEMFCLGESIKNKLGEDILDSDNEVMYTEHKIPKKLGHQTHHLIPQSLAKHEVWLKSGISIHDPENLLSLPNKAAAFFMGANVSIHEGNHANALKDGIEMVLNKLTAQGKFENWTDPDQYKQALYSEMTKQRQLCLSRTDYLNVTHIEEHKKLSEAQNTIPKVKSEIHKKVLSLITGVAISFSSSGIGTSYNPVLPHPLVDQNLHAMVYGRRRKPQDPSKLKPPFEPAFMRLKTPGTGTENPQPGIITKPKLIMPPTAAELNNRWGKLVDATRLRVSSSNSIRQSITPKGIQTNTLSPRIDPNAQRPNNSLTQQIRNEFPKKSASLSSQGTNTTVESVSTKLFTPSFDARFMKFRENSAAKDGPSAQAKLVNQPRPNTARPFNSSSAQSKTYAQRPQSTFTGNSQASPPNSLLANQFQGPGSGLKPAFSQSTFGHSQPTSSHVTQQVHSEKNQQSLMQQESLRHDQQRQENARIRQELLRDHQERTRQFEAKLSQDRTQESIKQDQLRQQRDRVQQSLLVQQQNRAQQQEDLRRQDSVRLSEMRRQQESIRQQQAMQISSNKSHVLPPKSQSSGGNLSYSGQVRPSTSSNQSNNAAMQAQLIQQRNQALMQQMRLQQEQVRQEQLRQQREREKQAQIRQQQERDKQEQIRLQQEQARRERVRQQQQQEKIRQEQMRQQEQIRQEQARQQQERIRQDQIRQQQEKIRQDQIRQQQERNRLEQVRQQEQARQQERARQEEAKRQQERSRQELYQRQQQERARQQIQQQQLAAQRARSRR